MAQRSGVTGLVGTKRWLLAVAAPNEAGAIAAGFGGDASEPIAVMWRGRELSAHWDMVVTGVGKANAAAGVARVFDAARHGGVLSLGIGGALPPRGVGENKLGLGSVVLASESVYADEGVMTGDGFRDLAALGLAPNMGLAGQLMMGVTADEETRNALKRCVEAEGVVATVSTCSGTDNTARRVQERTGAIVEAMEGAAVGFTALRLGEAVRFAEVRIVSNTTGERSRQQWDLAGALERLRRFASLL